jgi:ubiquinone biosynthesis protein Coq4
MDYNYQCKLILKQFLNNYYLGTLWQRSMGSKPLLFLLWSITLNNPVEKERTELKEINKN